MSNCFIGILWLSFKISCKTLPRIRLWDVMLPISNVWEVLITPLLLRGSEPLGVPAEILRARVWSALSPVAGVGICRPTNGSGKMESMRAYATDLTVCVRYTIGSIFVF